ncbi:MAG: hypothetical protein ABW039_06785 [Sphingobium sp.]
MMAASFWSLCLFACLFAAGFGGRDGRYFAAVFLGSVLLTMVAQPPGPWESGTRFWLMAVDTLLFVALVWLMLRSASYWPLWAAACQFMSVLTHIVTILLPAVSNRIYEGLSTVWVIPLLLFTIIGIELDRKHNHDRPYPPGPRPA